MKDEDRIYGVWSELVGTGKTFGAFVRAQVEFEQKVAEFRALTDTTHAEAMSVIRVYWIGSGMSMSEVADILIEGAKEGTYVGPDEESRAGTELGE